ncbi:hypothetical protein GCM10023321_02970 [Pseudonocardia eucalypti]|uniref:Uncharacterized protein n=2 Tax=Pseudonocardia eucalypti TaxID=648755 RepID=A0ABP9PEJ8_9PSEU
MSKVVAGGMAAATSSVFGSYFGALGTVGGAAVGAVATTVATNLYQRSIERTKDSVRNRVRRGAGLPDTPTYADAARAAKLAKQRTVRLDPALAAPAPAPARPRRTWKVLVGAPLMIFALALAAVTGIELAKGSMLFDNEGRTSIQRVLDPKPAVVTPSPAPAPVAPPNESEHDSSEGNDSRDHSDSRDERDDSNSRDDRGGLLDPKRDTEDPTDKLRPTDSNTPPPILPNLLGQ